MATSAVAGLRVWEHGGGGVSVLCLHETGATAEVWRPLARAVEAHATLIAYDRPGWGESPAPETYVRTTVGEQAMLAASVLDERRAAPVVLCGAGIGAVAALELALRRPELALGAVLVEPPLLAFVPAATEALSSAADLVRDAVATGGREEALSRYAGGELGALGAGAERIPEGARAHGRQAAASLFAELAAVPAWELPLGAMGLASRPSLIATGSDTPALLEAAARGLESSLARAEVRRLGPGLPHHDQAAGLADLIVEIAEL